MTRSSRKRLREEQNDPHSEKPPFILDCVPYNTWGERDPFVPKMNSYEYTDKLTGLTMVKVVLGLPGLQPGNVTIDLLHNKLTISGKSAEPSLGEGKCIVRELQHGRFSRVLTVPLGMRLEDFKARMENGLLVVTFPRDSPDQKPQLIPIETSNA